jgi:hypothetical protein
MAHCVGSMNPSEMVMADREDIDGANFGVTIVVIVVVALVAAALFIMLYRMDRSPKAAGAADIGADAIAHFSHRR